MVNLRQEGTVQDVKGGANQLTLGPTSHGEVSTAAPRKGLGTHMLARSWQKELRTGDPRELCQVIPGKPLAAFLCTGSSMKWTVIPASSVSEPTRG